MEASDEAINAITRLPSSLLPPSQSRTTSRTDTTRDSLATTLSLSTTTATKHAETEVLLQNSTSRPTSMSTTAEKAAGTSPPSNNSPFSRLNLQTLFCFSALTLSIFLVALDTVLIPTALPSISRDFHISDALYAWTGSAYHLANAASIPFWGKLSDVFGRKPIILIANSIFLGGSIICAVSIDAAMLVSGRAVQGLGGGGVNVLVYVCVADMFAIRDRSFYMGIVGAMYAVASALGPVIGGVFAQKLSWRWCFYINLPLVSIAIITLYFTVRLHSPRTPFFLGIKSIDWAGTFTILTATVFLLVGLQLGGTSTYSTPLVIAFLVVGSLTFAIFPFTQWWIEKHTGSPIMPLRIFRDISNLSALGVCACDALVFNSVAYFLPLYFQLILSASPSESGLYMLAIAIPLALVSFIGGWIINKSGRYLEVLQIGLVFMTIGVGLFITFGTTLNLGKIIGFLVIIGIGFGPNFHAPLIALQTRIQEADMAAGTSAFGFIRMVSGAIGVVVGQVVFQLLLRPQLSSFIEAGVSVAFAERLAGGEAVSEAGRVGLMPTAQRTVVRKGLAEALRGTWVFYAAVSAVGLFISFGIARGKLERGETASADARNEGVLGRENQGTV